jgi:hypothetical protein
MMTRDEHLEWCKKRALEYLDRGDIQNAVTSMLYDMDKHPETKVIEPLFMLGMQTIIDRNAEAARRFIVGFR